MTSILALLFLVAFGLFIWGLISPSSLSKLLKKSVSRKSAALGFGSLAFVLFVLVGITAPPKEITSSTDQTASGNVAQVQGAQDEQSSAPVTTTKTITETEAVPFESKTVESSSLNKGTTKITTVGVNGVKTRTIEITYIGDKETKRTTTKEEITTQPVTQVTTVGTKVVAAPKPTTPTGTTGSNCDPNYSGACVPIASDVDCAGGSGNGPAYVRGPVRVVGRDIYDLDRDGDGVGCE